MLELFATVGLSQQMWDSLTSRTELPCAADAYLLPHGGASPHGDCDRQYRRFQFREPAVMAHDGRYHAIYIKDASRKGMGLLSPVQLFPSERVQILLAEPGVIELESRRCRRVKTNCYECGMIFADGLAPSDLYKQLIARLGS